MRSFKLTLAYDGAAYLGWQVQAEGRTVQSELETALLGVTQQQVRVTASGRTDSGVHALGQVVSFESNTTLEPSTLQRALNSNLPRDIRVLSAELAEPGFHAIRDSISKRYRYFIQDGGVQDPFLRNWCWYLPQKLDDWHMEEAGGALLGEHDFASFQSAGSPRSTTVRTILDFKVERQLGQLCEPIVIEIAADGFLYNMVRNIVGTLVEVGLGKQAISWPGELIAAKDRTQAGPTAPPQGLFLVSVEYPPARPADSAPADPAEPAERP